MTTPLIPTIFVVDDYVPGRKSVPAIACRRGEKVLVDPLTQVSSTE
jgi:hypothetical protein